MDWYPISIEGKPTAPDILAAHGISFQTRNNVDMVLVADQAAADAAQALVDAYDPVPAARAEITARIKREAALRAESAISAADRDLAIVDALRLFAKNIKESLNQNERRKLEAIEAKIAPLAPISASRDAMLTQVGSMSSLDALLAFDETAPAKWGG